MSESWREMPCFEGQSSGVELEQRSILVRLLPSEHESMNQPERSQSQTQSRRVRSTGRKGTIGGRGRDNRMRVGCAGSSRLWLWLLTLAVFASSAS